MSRKPNLLLSHTPKDAQELAEAGYAACGHAACAAALGLAVRDVLPQFPGPGLWVNELRMRNAIHHLGFNWSSIGLPWPAEMSVTWLQGLGSWMQPRVPMGARNQRTHWVATMRDEAGVQWVYDLNLGEWVTRLTWRRYLLPQLLGIWKAKDFEVRATLSVKKI